ncbi:6-pyruvoyl tetrahydropterin synthase [Bacteriovorax sp. BSW11_IV]|nr:6-pyruvoyl tetrahydropterin synthase [Bacteriovorax sp. BSW11_IV]
MDFGGLKDVKEWLDHMFDHTFLVSEDDPYKDTFTKLDQEGVIQMRVLPNAGMEGTAQFVYKHVNDMVSKKTNGRVKVIKVEVRENEKNSAIFHT